MVRKSTNLLTASIICCESLMILRNTLARPSHDPVWPTWAESLQPVSGLYGLRIYIDGGELLSQIDYIAETRLIPAIDAWAQGFDTTLGDEFLMLPHGCMGAANKRYKGIAMRCVIVEHQPVGDRNVPSRMGRYYDVYMDDWKEEPCSMALSLWVHTPGLPARLLEGPQ